MSNRLQSVGWIVALLAFSALRPAAATAQGTCPLLGWIDHPWSNGALLILNPLDGSLSGGVSFPGEVTGLTRHPVTGELWALTAGPGNQRLFRVNPLGSSHQVVPTNTDLTDIAFRADGSLFAWDRRTGVDDLVTIVNSDPEHSDTPVYVSVVGDAGISTTGGGGLAFAPNGTLFFAGDGASGALRTVDPNTGQTTVVATLTGAPLPNGLISALTFTPSGTLLASNRGREVFADSFLVTIDTTTGAVTTRGPSWYNLSALAYTCLPAFDFEFDLRADIGVFRPGTGEWFVSRSAAGFAGPMQFGTSGDVPVPSDYDGDAQTDVAVFRPSTGEWFIRSSGYNKLVHLAWGAVELGDVPVPADYDGDARADIAIYRTSTGEWFVHRSSDSMLLHGGWGAPDDLPVVCDYDGDGKADFAVYRRSTGEWFVRRSSNGTLMRVNWGGPKSGDVPVPGDYDGDGKADLGVYRQSTGEWFVLASSTDSLLHGAWGAPSLRDAPVPADYDGDGKVDFAVYRGSTGQWFIRGSRRGFTGAVDFGAPSLHDMPLNRALALR